MILAFFGIIFFSCMYICMYVFCNCNWPKLDFKWKGITILPGKIFCCYLWIHWHQIFRTEIFFSKIELKFWAQSEFSTLEFRSGKVWMPSHADNKQNEEKCTYRPGCKIIYSCVLRSWPGPQTIILKTKKYVNRITLSCRITQ